MSSTVGSTSNTATNVVVYGYASSAFSAKIEQILLLKGIRHDFVNVQIYLPRPEISEGLGIGYRQIPVVAIGNDVYCDSSIIISALERRFPQSQGYKTLFPRPKRGGPPHTGLAKAFSRQYSNAVLSHVNYLIAWEKASPVLLKDRSSLYNTKINPLVLLTSRNRSVSGMASEMTVMDTQLSDGREWILDTEDPSLTDIDVYFLFNWARTHAEGVVSLYDEGRIPHLLKWMDRLSRYLSARQRTIGDHQIVDGDKAAKCIAASPTDSASVMIEFDEIESSRLGLRFGDIVAIAPSGAGKNFPTAGRLVGLNWEEFVIEVAAKYGTISVHFPRIGYLARSNSAAKL